MIIDNSLFIKQQMTHRQTPSVWRTALSRCSMQMVEGGNIMYKNSLPFLYLRFNNNSLHTLSYPSTRVLLAKRMQCSQRTLDTGRGIRTCLETSPSRLLNCSNSWWGGEKEKVNTFPWVQHDAAEKQIAGLLPKKSICGQENILYNWSYFAKKYHNFHINI